MAAYFEELNNNKIEEMEEEPKNDNINKKEETTADACGEDPNKKNDIEEDMKEAFAKIISVENGSPAEEAGLMPDDQIVNFNGILYKGVSYNPLMTLSEIVKNKIGEEIPVSIVRKNKNNILELAKLKITPHTWSGKGVLGCKFQIL